jgi:hypothetical protein
LVNEYSILNLLIKKKKGARTKEEQKRREGNESTTQDESDIDKEFVDVNNPKYLRRRLRHCILGQSHKRK